MQNWFVSITLVRDLQPQNTYAKLIIYAKIYKSNSSQQLLSLRKVGAEVITRCNNRLRIHLRSNLIAAFSNLQPTYAWNSFNGNTMNCILTCFFTRKPLHPLAMYAVIVYIIQWHGFKNTFFSALLLLQQDRHIYIKLLRNIALSWNSNVPWSIKFVS